MNAGVVAGVSDVGGLRSTLLTAVYGWTVLIGSVIGCIAGVEGTNGYARECTRFDHADISLRYRSRLDRSRPHCFPHDVPHRRSGDYAPSEQSCHRAVMGELSRTTTLMSELVLHPRSRSCCLGCLWYQLHRFLLVLAHPVYPPASARPLRPHRRSVCARDPSMAACQGSRRRGSRLSRQVPR